MSNTCRAKNFNFESECEDGKYWERYVASFLAFHFSDVEHRDNGMASTAAEVSKHKGDSDVYVHGVPIEVKSSDMFFHSESGVYMPYEEKIVIGVSSLSGLNPTPYGIVWVSRSTGTMLWIPTHTRKGWREALHWDGQRRQHELAYFARAELFQTMDTLVARLKQHLDNVTTLHNRKAKAKAVPRK